MKLKDILQILRWCIVIMLLCDIRAQAVDCTDDSHCSDDLFCNAARRCVPCIACADYGRLEPDHEVICVKSLTYCGECRPGFSSEDRSQKCDDIIPPQEEAEWSVIVISVLSVLGVVMFIVISVILYRRRGALCKKFLYDLDPPPPYYGQSRGARVATMASSERDHAWVSPSAPRSDDEMEAASINKVYRYSPEPANRAREDDGRQNVHLANPPHYIRLPFGHDMEAIERSADDAVNNNVINGHTVPHTPPNNEHAEVIQQPRARNNNNVVVPANTQSDVVLGVAADIRFDVPEEEIPFARRDSGNNKASNPNTEESSSSQIIVNNIFYNVMK